MYATFNFPQSIDWDYARFPDKERCIAWHEMKVEECKQNVWKMPFSMKVYSDEEFAEIADASGITNKFKALKAVMS